MDGLIAIGVFLACAAGVIFTIYWQARQERRRRALWESIAEKRGGKPAINRAAHPSLQFLGMIVPVDHVKVFVQLRGVEDDADLDVRSRACACYPLAAGPPYAAHARGGDTAMLEEMGIDLPKTGDEEFDKAFAIVSEVREAASAAWNKVARRAMVDHFRDCSVVSDGALVALNGTDLWGDETKINAAIDLLAALAGAGRHGVAAIEALPGIEPVPLRGEWDEPEPPAFVLHVEAVPVVLGPVATEDSWSVITRIAAENRGKARMEVAEVTPALELPAGLSPAASALLDKLEGCRLSADESRVVIDYPKVEEEADRLTAGAELVAQVATAQVRGGAYR